MLDLSGQIPMLAVCVMRLLVILLDLGQELIRQKVALPITNCLHLNCTHYTTDLLSLQPDRRGQKTVFGQIQLLFSLMADNLPNVCTRHANNAFAIGGKACLLTYFVFHVASYSKIS